RFTSHYYLTSTATSYIVTLSLHDALPISGRLLHPGPGSRPAGTAVLCGRRAAGRGQQRHPLLPGGPAPAAAADVHPARGDAAGQDRKSTRLNSSHVKISYAVFCLEKKNVK